MAAMSAVAIDQEKNMKRVLIFSALASVLAASAAYADQLVPVGHFHSVSIEGSGHITFIPGAQQRVVLKKGDTKNTEIKIKDNGDLVFKSCAGHGWLGWMNSCPMDYELDVEITTPELSGVDISGSGKIESRPGFALQPKFAIDISGSGNIDAMNIPAGSASVSISGSGKVRVNARNSLKVDIAGSGSVVYSGHPQLSQSIAGSGSVTSAP
jgi:hypothetical protein